MKKGLWGCFVVFLVFALLTIGVPNPGPVKAAEEIKVGVIFPLTGPVASIGVASQRGVTMAVDRINSEGGIKSMGGAKIKLFFGDDEAKPNVAMTEGERLIKQEKVDALIGSYTSSCSFPLTQVAEVNKIPILVGSSAKDEITERKFKYTFRAELKASWIARDQVNFIKFLASKTGVPVKTIGLLYEDSGWGQSFAKDVVPLIKQAGFQLVSEIPYPKDTKDMRSFILKLKAANPDLVLQESYTEDAILVTKTMHELQFYSKGILGTGTGHSSPFYHDGVGGLDEYLMKWESWSPAIPLEEVRVRSKEFFERFKTPMDTFSAKCYTVGFILAQGYEIAGSKDKDKLRDALRKVNVKVGDKGNTHLFPMKFDADGQAPEAVGVHTQVVKGQYVVLAPEIGATGKPVYPAPPWSERLKK